jgi:hypothetical protein
MERERERERGAVPEYGKTKPVKQSKTETNTRIEGLQTKANQAPRLKTDLHSPEDPSG